MDEKIRIILKRYKIEEKNLLSKLVTDKEVMRFVGEGKPLSDQEIDYLWYRIHKVNYIENKIGVWGVFDKQDNRYIGHAAIKLRPENKTEWEIIYYLLKTEWGKGYGTETAKQIIKFGFEKLNLEKIYATVDEENLPSIKILEKAGMKFLRNEFDENGKFLVYFIENTID